MSAEKELLTVNVTLQWSGAGSGTDWNDLGPCQVSVYHNPVKKSFRCVGWNDESQVLYPSKLLYS